METELQEVVSISHTQWLSVCGSRTVRKPNCGHRQTEATLPLVEEERSRWQKTTARGPETKKYYAVEDQQQFKRPTTPSSKRRPHFETCTYLGENRNLRHGSRGD
jgi:hypothetical protein